MYINVKPEDQQAFHARVLDSQLDGYIFPNSKEEYWQVVNEFWPHLKQIVLTFTLSESSELDQKLKDKSPDLAIVFEDAWFNAPDDGKIHLIPAWNILCDLCSERHLISE